MIKAKIVRHVRGGRLHVLLLPALVVASVCVSGEVPKPPPIVDEATATQPAQATLEEALAYAQQAFDTKQFDQARDWYLYVLKREPRNGQAKLGIPDCLRATGRDFEAQQLYDEFIRNEGRNNPQAHLGLGLVLQKSQWHRLAEKHLSKCLKLDPKNTEAQKAMAVSLQARNEMDRARGYAEAAVNANPADHEAHHIYAGILLNSRPPDLAGATRQTEQAIELVRQKFAENPAEIQPLRVMRTYYQMLLTVLTRQESNQPNDAALVTRIYNTLQGLADIEYSLRQYDALPYAVRAAELAPGDVTALTTLAELQWNLHLHDHLAETCWTILEFEPDHALAKQRLGEVGLPTSRPATQPSSRPATQPSSRPTTSPSSP